jgi:hypothetical protein
MNPLVVLIMYLTVGAALSADQLYHYTRGTKNARGRLHLYCARHQDMYVSYQVRQDRIAVIALAIGAIPFAVIWPLTVKGVWRRYCPCECDHRSLFGRSSSYKKLFSRRGR